MCAFLNEDDNFSWYKVCLQPVGEFLSLTVPGLAEGRPSLLIGDKVLLSSPSDPDGPVYEGFIHEVCSWPYKNFQLKKKKNFWKKLRFLAIKKKKMSSFWQFFESQMAIFWRVRFVAMVKKLLWSWRETSEVY